MIKFKNILKENLKPIKNFPKIWYHATHQKTAKEIMQNGFQILGSDFNNYGKAVYLANPPHIFDRSVIKVILDNSWKFTYIDETSEKQYINFHLELLKNKDIYNATFKRGIENHVNEKELKKYMKHGSVYIEPNTVKYGVVNSGFDGIIVKVNNEGFYKGLWVAIYNVEKLNTMKRELISSTNINNLKNKLDKV